MRTKYSKGAFSDHYKITVETANKNLIRKIELLAIAENTKEDEEIWKTDI